MAATAAFIPRTTFPALSLPRSYYLGHHAAGLAKMKTILTSIDLVLEVRDYRVPLTSRNPLLDTALAGRPRLIVYTHRDLCAHAPAADAILRAWHRPTPVHFFAAPRPASTRPLLRAVAAAARARFSLTGHRALVAGMPNVGKSTLLNALRREGVQRGPAARTGGQPGVTRAVGTGVKIVEGADNDGPVYLLDTPGVFVPFVPDPQAMLKLALCGCVKEGLIAPVALADYLLFRINAAPEARPGVYARYHGPTNEIVELLEGIARTTGRLKPGGVPDLEAAAVWMVQQWRAGKMGLFGLDEVVEGALERRMEEERAAGGSLNQARKVEKEARRARGREKRGEAMDS